MNKLFFLGHIGDDPVHETTQKGFPVCKVSVAVNLSKEETVWYKVSFFGERWKNFIPFLTKGKKIAVVGSLKVPHCYVGKDGTPKCILSVLATDVTLVSNKAADEPSYTPPKAEVPFQSEPPF